MFYIYNKRIKNRITKQIANQKRPESIGMETYDDIDLPPGLGGKDIYDTYEAVGDEETRYADPYYSTEQDYVQMPHNAGIPQYYNDNYRRNPNLEPAYLEMTPIPTPRASLETDTKYKL